MSIIYDSARSDKNLDDRNELARILSDFCCRLDLIDRPYDVERVEEIIHELSDMWEVSVAILAGEPEGQKG